MSGMPGERDYAEHVAAFDRLAEAMEAWGFVGKGEAVELLNSALRPGDVRRYMPFTPDAELLQRVNLQAKGLDPGLPINWRGLSR